MVFTPNILVVWFQSIVVVRVLHIINRAYLHMTRLLSLQHTIQISQTMDTSTTDIATTITMIIAKILPDFFATGVRPGLVLQQRL